MMEESVNQENSGKNENVTETSLYHIKREK